MPIVTEQKLLRLFWSKVDKTKGGCWNWTGCRMDTGYGIVWDGTKQVKAHRFAYELLIGEIPLGFYVCHKCDNKGCVNPDHLFTGTAKDNTQDALAKGRLTGNPYGRQTKEHRREAAAAGKVEESSCQN